jgi:hypothetical protein
MADADSEPELVWVSGEEPGVRKAESTLVAPDAVSAHYEVRQVLPGLDRSRWSLTLCQVLDDGSTRPVGLGSRDSEVTAKAHARTWERHGTSDTRPPVISQS